jgi:hypothetical protein
MWAAIRTDHISRMVNVDPILRAISELSIDSLPDQDNIQTPRFHELKLVVIVLGNNFHRRQPRRSALNSLTALDDKHQQECGAVKTLICTNTGTVFSMA